MQLDELDKLDKIIHAWIRIHLQCHTSIERTLVYWLGWLTARQVTWVQSLSNFREIYFVEFI